MTPPVTATAEGIAAAVALLSARLQGDVLGQEAILEDVSGAETLRSLVMLTSAVLRAVTPDEGASLLRSIGEGSVEIAARREAPR